MRFGRPVLLITVFFRVIEVAETRLTACVAVAAEPQLRLIVEADAGGYPVDERSLVRLLVYASEFDIEGIIEADVTYRGWFTVGSQSGEWGNKQFVKQHIVGHGALGDFFNSKMNSIKMGDTPSVDWLLHGMPDDLSQPGWGGQFVRAWQRLYSRFDRLTTSDDQKEVLSLPHQMHHRAHKTGP